MSDRIGTGERISFTANGHETEGYLAAKRVVFYGIHPNVKPDLAALEAPVLGLFAGRDGMVTPDAVHQLDQRLTEAGKRHEFHTYPGADHAFFNDTRPEVYDADAAGDAWARTVRFFRTELLG